MEQQLTLKKIGKHANFCVNQEAFLIRVFKCVKHYME